MRNRFLSHSHCEERGREERRHRGNGASSCRSPQIHTSACSWTQFSTDGDSEELHRGEGSGEHVQELHMCNFFERKHLSMHLCNLEPEICRVRIINVQRL